MTTDQNQTPEQTPESEPETQNYGFSLHIDFEASSEDEAWDALSQYIHDQIRPRDFEYLGVMD